MKRPSVTLTTPSWSPQNEPARLRRPIWQPLETLSQSRLAFSFQLTSPICPPQKAPSAMFAPPIPTPVNSPLVRFAMPRSRPLKPPHSPYMSENLIPATSTSLDGAWTGVTSETIAGVVSAKTAPAAARTTDSTSFFILLSSVVFVCGSLHIIPKRRTPRAPHISAADETTLSARASSSAVP